MRQFLPRELDDAAPVAVGKLQVGDDRRERPAGLHRLLDRPGGLGDEVGAGGLVSPPLEVAHERVDEALFVVEDEDPRCAHGQGL